MKQVKYPQKMIKAYKLIACLFISAVFVGCGGTKVNPALAKARAVYQKAESNPDVVKNAPVAMYEASKSLQNAEKAEEPTEIERQANRTERQVEMAMAQAEQKMAENKIDDLTKQSEKLIIERSRKQASQSAMEAEQARKQAEEMRRQAEAKAAETDKAMQAAEKMKQEADQARLEAEKAKQELAQLQQDLSELKAKQTDKGIVLTLGDVLFETSKAELQTGAFRTIQKVADFLLKNPKRNVLIEGFTDSRGSDEFNQRLSEDRANSVRSALVDDEVPPERISIKGYGKRYPVASNDTAAGQQQNRRVEITILNEGVAAESLFR
jgi:OmpA-OmpF porin, OOP family